MSKQPILKVFASHPFLCDLDDQHLMLLASGARPFSAAPGEYLGHEGETAEHFFLIQSGHVSIETRRPEGDAVRVQTVGPGEAVGWSWLVPPHLGEFDSRALDTVKGVELNGEWLREQCEQDLTLSHHLLKRLVTVLAECLSATRGALHNVDRENLNGTTFANLLDARL